MRAAFGVGMAIDAFLKWRPAFADHYVGYLQNAAKAQPAWLSRRGRDDCRRAGGGAGDAPQRDERGAAHSDQCRRGRNALPVVLVAHPGTTVVLTFSSAPRVSDEISMPAKPSVAYALAAARGARAVTAISVVIAIVFAVHLVRKRMRKMVSAEPNRIPQS